jgi:hypothetical protein
MMMEQTKATMEIQRRMILARNDEFATIPWCAIEQKFWPSEVCIGRDTVGIKDGG